MNIRKLIAVPALMTAFAFAGTQQAHAAGQGNSATIGSTMTIQNFAQVSVASNGVSSITPSLSEYIAGSRTGDTIGLSVYTNDTAGCKVTVHAGSGDSRSTKIEPGDILVKSDTAGSALSSYTALSTTAQDLWSNSAVTDESGTAVTVDVQFQNLKRYTTGAAGADKNYTNTITFTAVTNS